MSYLVSPSPVHCLPSCSLKTPCPLPYQSFLSLFHSLQTPSQFWNSHSVSSLETVQCAPYSHHSTSAFPISTLSLCGSHCPQGVSSPFLQLPNIDLKSIRSRMQINYFLFTWSYKHIIVQDTWLLSYRFYLFRTGKQETLKIATYMSLHTYIHTYMFPGLCF